MLVDDLKIQIGNRFVGANSTPFIIAEISANHNGNKDRAFEIIRQAAAAGAHAVKFQTYTADTITLDCAEADFICGPGLWAGQKLHNLYTQGSLPWEWHEELFGFSKSLGLSVISTPFDESAVDFLINLGVDALKIASFELTHIPLIKKAAQQRLPLIMSTGMATDLEIKEAIEVAHQYCSDRLILLHCVSSYPTPAREYNLQKLKKLKNYGFLVGLSDHCVTNEVAIASVALGASVIEKHFTLDRFGGGLDDSFSLEPGDLKELVEMSSNVHTAIQHRDVASYDTSSRRYRQSIYPTRNISRGEEFSTENLKVVRPGFSIPAKYFEQMLGKIANRDIKFGERLTFDDFNWG